MSYDNNFSKHRSHFYLRLFGTQGSIRLKANEFTKNLIDKCHDKIEDLSPVGWERLKNYDNLYNLWIPNDRVDCCKLDDFIQWAELCHSCVWVRLNRNTEDYFDENILDFCICSDWNYSFDGESGRTEIGEAEYCIKYLRNISQENCSLVERYIGKCLDCISNSIDDVLITTIPAIKAKQNKLSWLLAQFVAEELEADFLTTTLLKDKPQMKSLDVCDKIETWREIYANDDQIETSIDEDELTGKTVIIVDDLYQSGASMWCYAEFLKSMGVSNVIGITLVKSLKDSDNKKHS